MYKTLLVPVDGRSKSSRSLEVARRIADTYEAHVVGLFVKPPYYMPSAVVAEGSADLVRKLQEEAMAHEAQQAKARFDGALKPAITPRVEWRVAQGPRAETVALHARYADLVIINQTDRESEDATHFGEAVLLAVGRPVLLVPYSGDFDTFGENVLVCWDASREASRAVTDALPLLKSASKVTVLTVDGSPSAYGHGDSPGSDLALYLARHGIDTVASQTAAGGISVGNVILSRAADLSADLIVMGAYGHSRVRELLMGGATRTVLQSMTLPVLMSH
jgi:nucleotide-binding universal stress UspA family protein